ncbi:MAG: hypothetical protein DLM67_16015 [Candidatus Nephthysia bennettiae]|nr:MAG: hypothetical protein DLM67_16015 [Candidatus Dormibacteraeota bacterium]
MIGQSFVELDDGRRFLLALTRGHQAVEQLRTRPPTGVETDISRAISSQRCSVSVRLRES